MFLRCDFEIAAKRTLPARELGVFQMHFLAGGDWRLCSRRLHLDRGNFFHAVYRVELLMGRELLRRGIFPLELYFDWGHAPLLPPPLHRNKLSSPGNWNIGREPAWVDWKGGAGTGRPTPCRPVLRMAA